MGFASMRGRRSKAEAHLAEVNGWTPYEVTMYVEEAFDAWRIRSQEKWTLDVGVLVEYGVDEAEIEDLKGRT
jgi:hypothetical protein